MFVHQQIHQILVTTTMHVSDAFTHHLIKIRVIKDLQRVFQRKPRQLSKEFNHTSIFHLKNSRGSRWQGAH